MVAIKKRESTTINHIAFERLAMAIGGKNINMQNSMAGNTLYIIKGILRPLLLFVLSLMRAMNGS